MSIGAAAWVVLGLVTGVIEVIRPERGVVGLLRAVADQRSGRLLLFGLWALLGWHLLVRSGVAPG